MKVWKSRFRKHVEYLGKVYECKVGPYYWFERSLAWLPFMGNRVSDDMDHLLDNFFQAWHRVRPATNAEQLVERFREDSEHYIRALIIAKTLTEDTT